MKRYLKNLWGALCGSDPFRTELEEARERLEKAGENMRSLQDQLYAALNHWDGCQMKLEEANKALEAATETAACKQLKSMQRLVENLREKNKDLEKLMKQQSEADRKELEQQGLEFQERLERVKHEYQQRIEEYNEEIDKLRNR